MIRSIFSAFAVDMLRTTIFTVFFLFKVPCEAESCYKSGEYFPLMGDWVGNWIQPHPDGREGIGHKFYAQLLPIRGGTHYRVLMLPALYNQCPPRLKLDAPIEAGKVLIDTAGIQVSFEDKEIIGEGRRGGKLTKFKLKKRPFQPKGVGKKAPQGAVILFDGSDLSAWQHKDGRAATWKLLENTMEVVTSSLKSNKANNLGGDIMTRRHFGSIHLHLEFRYPVEAKLSGQKRGNSGLFINPICEIQILNNYAGTNYWNQCGALYRLTPAKVNASGPPLAWQCYEVDIDFIHKIVCSLR